MAIHRIFAHLSLVVACGQAAGYAKQDPSDIADTQERNGAPKPVVEGAAELLYGEIRQELGSWAEVLNEAPDKSVVIDAEAVRRIEETGLPWRIKDKRSGAVLVLVPPGDFLRGAASQDEYLIFEFEFPWRRRVRVAKPFYLGQTELTCRQWANVMGTTPKYVKEANLEPEEAPFVGASMEEFAPFLLLTGLSLPRDSDWEYACRASSGAEQVESLYDFARVQGNVDVWKEDLTPVIPVATREANAWGFFDMLGGAWESTSTVFDPTWEGPPEGELYDSIDDDAVGNSEYTQKYGLRFTQRGGSLGAPEVCATPWHVSETVPTKAHITFGYRVAWYPEEYRPDLGRLLMALDDGVDQDPK
ncbi:MAG: formylglycine-generating enzyme family protein [Cyanobacteria bacterium J06648_11]